MSNAWVTYPRHEDNPPKGGAILDETTASCVCMRQWSKGGDPDFGRDLPAWERPTSHQLVGRVTAYQGDDG